MNNIDDIFKDALESHVEPYNPQAWESLSKQLDKGIPPRKNPFLKWGLPSALLVLGVAVGSWYVSNTATPVKRGAKATTGSSKKQNPEGSSANTGTPVQQPSSSNGKNPGSVQLQTAENSVPTGKVNFNCLNQTTDNFIITTVGDVPTPLVTPETIMLDNKLTPAMDIIPSLEQVSGSNPKPLVAFNALSVPSCANASFEFDNTNEYPLELRGVNEQGIPSRVLPAKSKTALTLSPGQYELWNGEEAVQRFILGQSPNVEVYTDELNYSSGLPVKNFKIKSEASVKDILVNGKSIGASGKDFSLPFYTEGGQKLFVQVMDEKGCMQTTEESFYIPEKYNLLAVNAFEPLSQDARKNSFIPYALTIRNTPFRMIIIDPSDGGVVFETRDAAMPWDGIDKRSGRMIDANKAYAWRVVLSNPEPGEKAEYMGTIVRL